MPPKIPSPEPGPWPRVTFQQRGSVNERPSVIGFCRLCGSIAVYLAEDVYPVKNSDQWYRQCGNWRGGARGAQRCKGTVGPPKAKADEEALVAAYLVGGYEAAAQLWKQIRRKEGEAAKRALRRKYRT